MARTCAALALSNTHIMLHRVRSLYCAVNLLLMICFAYGYIPNNLMQHPAWVYLDRFDCGENAADRIIGGINAALGQFPSIARLGYASSGEPPDWRCGGVLVSDRHVVTAAHCAIENLKVVRLGEYNIRLNPDCQGSVCAPPVQDIPIKRVVSHPSFNQPKFHNDIAVIELVKPAQLHDYVSPICLPRAGQMGGLKVGDMVSVAGWGTSNLTYFDEISVLRTVQLPVMNTEECDKLKIGNFVAGPAEICAGGVRNRDTCEGDSGGPLMKIFDSDDDGPKTYLVGVVSFGPTSCGRRIPGIYASAAHFLGWILDRLVGL